MAIGLSDGLFGEEKVVSDGLFELLYCGFYNAFCFDTFSEVNGELFALTSPAWPYADEPKKIENETVKSSTLNSDF